MLRTGAKAGRVYTRSLCENRSGRGYVTRTLKLSYPSSSSNPLKSSTGENLQPTLDKKRKATEEDYFNRKNKELVEKMIKKTKTHKFSSSTDKIETVIKEKHDTLANENLLDRLKRFIYNKNIPK